MSAFGHEEVVIRTGRRSGLPVIVAVHSTALGQAVGGCRLWHYPDWADGLTDALRLSAGMTAKCAAAGLANGGGKTVIAVPAGTPLGPARRRAALHDAADVIASLGGRYATGPDVGTTPEDMAVIGERTSHVFCTPARCGGAGDSSPHTALGTLAAIRAVCQHLYGDRGLAGRRLAVVGLGSVGGRLARLLAEGGAQLVVSDIDAGKRALAAELGAAWATPAEAVTAPADILVPAALGGILTADVAGELRCRAIAGPANNQLAAPGVAGLLHQRGILWVPDYIASAGGVSYILTVELHRGTPGQARARVEAIGDTVAGLLATAGRAGSSPAQAAEELVARRLQAAGPPGPGPAPGRVPDQAAAGSSS
ncbi:MAG: Glu/Leu/Phe/Val dehydrogenase dimerization domain-containing protein [Gemmatimonadota bacterium]